MTVTQFDIANDLTDVTDLLTRTLTYDVITNDLVRQHTVRDVDYDPALTLVARDGETLVGFMQAVTRPVTFEGGVPTGALKWWAVHPAYEGKGVATALLEQVESLMRGRVESVIVINTGPGYYQSGLDPRYTRAHVWLLYNGYSHVGATVNLIADLKGRSWDTSEGEVALEMNGVSVRRATEDDQKIARTFMEAKFPGDWPNEVDKCFKNDPISLHIAVSDGKVVGFAGFDTVNIGLPWFGPMGTVKSARGQGIGEILLKRCMADQLKQGHPKSIIPWVGPIPFYNKHTGATVDRIFWTYSKTL